MLEHQMKVLRNLAYDEKLFKKEILKSFSWLNEQDSLKLKAWLLQHYGGTHNQVLTDVFNSLKQTA